MKHRFLKKAFAVFGLVSILTTALPMSVHATEGSYENSLANNPTPSLALESNTNIGWPQQPEVNAESAFLMDMDSGIVLFSKNPHEKLYPASITKIMTALLTIENCSLKENVTFSKYAVNGIEPGSSHIWTSEGEVLTVQECLYAVMLASANDVCLALAEHISGDVDSFAQLMNQRAAELGCQNTNFTNPNGLHDENHYTTAYDMALIAKAAYKNPVFQTICETRRYTIPATDKTADPRYLTNHHQMFPENELAYAACTGGKTGFTSDALNTLVTYAEKNGQRLVCTVLRADSAAASYEDTKALLDYGFDNFENAQIYDRSEHPEANLLYPNLFYGLPAALISNKQDCLLTIPVTAPTKDIKIETTLTEHAIVKTYSYNGYLLGTQEILLAGAQTLLTQKPINMPILNPEHAGTSENGKDNNSHSGNSDSNSSTENNDASENNTATGTPNSSQDGTSDSENNSDNTTDSADKNTNTDSSALNKVENFFNKIPLFAYIIAAVLLLFFFLLQLWVGYKRAVLRRQKLMRKKKLHRQRQAQAKRDREEEELNDIIRNQRQKQGIHYSELSEEDLENTEKPKKNSNSRKTQAEASSRRRSSSSQSKARRASSSTVQSETSGRRRSSSSQSKARQTSSGMAQAEASGRRRSSSSQSKARQAAPSASSRRHSSASTHSNTRRRRNHES